MPWRGIYRAVHAFGGDNRFVLSTSGHVQSILRPPNLANSEYFVNDTHPPDPDQWLRSAQRRPGTWWADWSDWLRQHAGRLHPAPSAPGCRDFAPVCAAPGEYVLEPMV